MTTFFRKLAFLLRRRSKENELSEELRFHLEQEARESQEAGVPEDEAQWAARRDLGNITAVQEHTRAAWSWVLVEQLLQDLHYAARTILHNPAFTILAALSLGLGIGANTAIYSFMDALLLRALPVSDPGSLVVLNWHVSPDKRLRNSVLHNVSGYVYDDPDAGLISPIFPYPAFELLQKSTNVLSILFAYHPLQRLNVLTRGQAEIVNGEYVSGAYFRGLGVIPAAGRLITEDDDRMGARPVIVLSHAFAQTRFGDADLAAGRTMLINNVAFTVAGVAPPAFFGVDPAAAPQLYLPMHSDILVKPDQNRSADSTKEYVDDHYYWIEMMGRLRPGVTFTQAQAALGTVFNQWVATTATNDVERKNLPEFLLKKGVRGLDNLRRDYSKPFSILLAMVGLILAIACANIANLLLARATARRREMAVRLSMGAGRGRVIRQLLTESLLLASIGGCAGIFFATWGVRVLGALLANQSDPFPLHADLNWHVLAAAVTLTVTTGLLFGLAPAIQATRVDVAPVLKESRTGRGRGHTRFSFGRVLVVVQIALSLLLLVAAGLFVRTLSNLRSLDMGFRRENVLVFTINARDAGHREPEIISFYSGLQKRFASLPGVRTATAANSPLVGGEAWGWPVVPLGNQKPDHAPSGHGSGMASSATRVLATGPAFFTTMQIPLLAGREFDERDHAGSPPVAIVNGAWVKANMEGRNPIGQQIVSFGLQGKPQQLQIIGVAKNAKYEELRGDFPVTVYMPFEQDLNLPVDEMTFFLRTAGDPLAFANTVRQIVQQADPRIPVTNLGTQATQIDERMNEEILFARLSTGFAILALLIAGIGLYGTTSYTIARRTGEIGIRMALGAQRVTVVWMVLRDVLIMAMIGLAISIPAALATARLIESLLFGVKPADAGALAASAAILLMATLLAAYVPARKASHIDPMSALRHE